MFRGSAAAKIDDKGRLKVPTDFRRDLETEFGQDLFVTSLDDGKSTSIYPLAEWEKIEARLLAMPSTDPKKNAFLDRVSYFGQQMRLDAQGRIVIHPILRERAGMSGDVVVLGRLNHLVVWNHERFLARLDEHPFTE